MPVYQYEHPVTKEVFEDLRPIKNRHKPFIAPDGVKCPRIVVPTDLGYCGRAEKEREVFELDPGYVKKCRPKFVKYRDGHREKYDPGKHF